MFCFAAALNSGFRKINYLKALSGELKDFGLCFWNEVNNKREFYKSAKLKNFEFQKFFMKQHWKLFTKLQD